MTYSRVEYERRKAEILAELAADLCDDADIADDALDRDVCRALAGILSRLADQSACKQRAEGGTK